MPSGLNKLPFFLFLFIFAIPLFAQTGVNNYVIAGISVEGNKFSDAQTIITISGLRAGDQLAIPGDNKLQLAIKNLWHRKQFSNIEIVIDRITNMGVFLIIKVSEFQRLSEILVENNNELSSDDIVKEIGRTYGDILNPYDLYLANQRIKKKYKEEGYMFTRIESELKPTDTAQYSKLRVMVNEGMELHVESIEFIGNAIFSDKDLADEFDKTHSKAWWQIWRSSKFDLSEYEKDKELLKKFYKTEGFRDFELLKDSLDFNDKSEDLHIKIWINEGKRFFIRDLKFSGNTIYPSELLLKRLDFKKGDVYNQEKFQMNLSGNQESSDATSVYMDNGYLFARMEIEEKRILPDSIDITLNVTEGDRVTIRKVEIIGNEKTKDKVIRRELYTRPGDYFSRSAIIRSVRGLGMLNFFNPEALKPDIKLVDKTRVDVQYKVEERSTDTFNASIGFAGTFGFTGALGFSFNNFSILEPFQGGAGQIFNFNWEFGQANRLQNFSIGFTEPWLFDSPTTVGFSLYDSKINYNYVLRRTGGAVNLGRRFRWPDDYFRTDWSLRYQINDVGTSGGTYYRPGLTREITIAQSITRMSLDNMIFPRSGSRLSLSNEWAMGAVDIGSTDYLKSSLKYDVYNPLMQIDGNDRLIFYLGTNWGYVTGIRSDTTIPPIDLYYMGGNGLSGFGVTPLRGYSDRSIGPYNGGKLMAKHTAELRFGISLDPMPIYIFGFAEAGNVWSNFKGADLFNLKRSAGLGLQVLINPIGLIGISYGYGFDRLDDTGEISGWKFLFHLGQ